MPGGEGHRQAAVHRKAHNRRAVASSHLGGGVLGSVVHDLDLDGVEARNGGRQRVERLTEVLRLIPCGDLDDQLHAENVAQPH
jgi:hypothetical protein